MHLLHRSNDTGRVRERTNRRRLPCEIDTGGTLAGTARGSLAKGSWHGAAVTEGFTESTSSKYKPMWKGEGF